MDRTRQWINLGAASFMHAASDSFAGVLPVAMPLICEQFKLGTGRGIQLLAIFGIVANWAQLLVGHLRPRRERPLFAPVGLVLLLFLCVVGFLPGRESMWPILCAMVTATGLGVAFTHPEGLRMAHGLVDLPDHMATTVFLQGGFVGFSAAGLVAGIVLQRTGLGALAAFAAGPVLALAFLRFFRLRLAAEETRPSETGVPVDRPHVRFWVIMAMAVPTTTAGAIIMNLLPTQGLQIGFNLAYGGKAIALISAGGAAGSFLWAALSHHRPPLHCCTAALLSGVPFLAAYQLLASHSWAIWLLLPAGLGSSAAFPVLVSLARHAHGLNLGGRMGVVIGGSWGVAGLVLIALGGVAESFGVRPILNLAWLGHLLSGLLGLAFILADKAPRQLAPSRPL